MLVRIAQGHELDKERLVKELGDVAWYLAEAATALDLHEGKPYRVYLGNEEIGDPEVTE